MNLLFFVFLSFSFGFHGSEASSGNFDVYSHHNHVEFVIESAKKKILDSLELEAPPSVTIAQRSAALEILKNTEGNGTDEKNYRDETLVSSENRE